MTSTTNRSNLAAWRHRIAAKTPRIIKTIRSIIVRLLKFILAPIRRLPIYPKLRAKLLRLPRKKLVSAVVVGGLAIIALASYLTLAGQTVKVVSQPKSTSTTLEKGTPDYATVLPAGKTIGQLGGWTRVSPPDRNPVYAYVDKIGNYSVNVSEQPLPADFKPDTNDQIDQLAKDFKANEKITVGSTTVHIGTSEKGPQSLIFSQNDLLILIKSSVRLENSQWSDYVSSLN